MTRTRGNSQKIQHRRGSAAEWTVTNPVLLAGELGYETDTTRLKFGDGGSQWTSLPYVGSYGSSSLDGLSDVTLASPAAGAVLRYSGTEWVNYTLAKSDVGLGNVDNTSDANKPVSTAQSADATSKANAAQAYAVQRGNHTGTQSVSTITVSSTDRLLGRSSAGAGTGEEIVCTSAGRALLDDADNAAQRTTLGLGTMATQSAASVAITGGSINGTSVGATTASTGAFTTLSTSGNALVGSSSAAGLRYFDINNLDSSSSSSGSILRLITTNVTGTGNVSVDFVKYKNGTFVLSNNESNAAACTAMFVAGVEAMRLTSTGRVGIGTSTPDSQLTVYTSQPFGTRTYNIGTNAANYAVSAYCQGAANGQNTGVYVVTENANSNIGVRIVSPPAGANNWALYCDSPASSFFTGAVGIGTNSHNSKLAVSTATAGQSCFLATGSSGSGLYVDWLGSAQNIYDASVHYFRTPLGANQRTLCAVSNRTLIYGNSEAFGLGVTYSDGGGAVYFGATSGVGTPDCQISNAGGVALLHLAYGGSVGVGGIAASISSGIGVHINGSTLRLGAARTPANSSATGNQGELCWDSSYLYVCIATNTWRRIAHSTW